MMKISWFVKRLSIRLSIVFLCFLGMMAINYASADLVSTAKGTIECRILEDSAEVVVIETVAREYIVIDKSKVTSVKKEPPEEYFYRRAKFHEEENEENQALMDYVEVINRNPDHQEAQEGIEEIRYRRNKRKWEQGIQQASNYLNEDRYWKALDQYKKVLDMQPEERVARQIVNRMSKVHSQLAYLFYDHSAEEFAILELAKAEELNPENAEIYYVLARLHEHNGKLELARLEYERALELDPNHSLARNKLMNLINRMRGISRR